MQHRTSSWSSIRTCQRPAITWCWKIVLCPEWVFNTHCWSHIQLGGYTKRAVSCSLDQNINWSTIGRHSKISQVSKVYVYSELMDRRNFVMPLISLVPFTLKPQLWLQEQKFPESAAREILADIFGCEHGDDFSEGFCWFYEWCLWSQGCKSHGGERLESNARTQPGFYGWFIQHKAEIMKLTMLRPIHKQ